MAGIKKYIGIILSIIMTISEFNLVIAGEDLLNKEYNYFYNNDNVVSSQAIMIDNETVSIASIEVKGYNNYGNILKNGYICCDKKYTYYINF